MKPKDLVEYQSGVATQRYKGIITWVDKEKRECGVVIIEPKEGRGGAEVLKMDEAEIVVLEEFKPTTFRRDLSSLSVEDLQAEIEELRSGRITSKQVRKKQRKVDPQEALLMQKLKNLPPDIAAKLREGLAQIGRRI